MGEEAKTVENSPQTGPRPGGSEDVARAIECLINFVTRWTLFFFAGVLGLLALTAWRARGPWWVGIPAAVIGFVAFSLACSIATRGKFAFDNHGPMVIVPGEATKPSDDCTHQ